MNNAFSKTKQTGYYKNYIITLSIKNESLRLSLLMLFALLFVASDIYLTVFTTFTLCFTEIQILQYITVLKIYKYSENKSKHKSF